MTSEAMLEQTDDIEMIASEDGSDALKTNPIFKLPVTLTVSVGGARITVEQLLALNMESVVELDAGIDDPVKIFVGDRLFATGDLVETEAGCLGVRVSEVMKSK